MPVSKVNRPKPDRTIGAMDSFTIEGEAMLTVAETARALRISDRTVYRMIGKGKLPFRTIGKRRFVLRDPLVDLVNQGGIAL